MADKELPKAVRACMELLIRRKHRLISGKDWDLLCRLPSHAEDFKQNGNYGNMELMARGARQFTLTEDTFGLDFVAVMYARVSLSLPICQNTAVLPGIAAYELLNIDHSDS